MPSTPLFAPDEFFSQQSPSLAGAAIILLFTGVVAVASAVPYADQLPFEVTLGALVFSVLIGGLIGAAGIWLVSTAVVYLLTATVGGTGTVARTAANIGWASLPLLLMNTVSTLTLWALAFTGNAPAIEVTQMRLPSWLLVFNAITSLIGAVWLGYLLTYAIRDARNLDIRRSAGVAGIVVTILLLNTFVRLF